MGQANAAVWMPAFPVTGPIFRELGGDFCIVEETNFTVPLLSTGLGPYVNALKVTEILAEPMSDCDFDADVDGSDLDVFAKDSLRDDCSPSAHFDGDGDVDEEDLAVFTAEMGWVGLP